MVPKTGTITGTITGTVPAVGEFTVPVWAPETGTVLRGEYGGRLSKVAGYRKNMSNIAKVKFLFASNIWEQLIFIPF